MIETRERFDVETLWVDSILTSSVPVDWREAHGTEGEGWTSHQAPECGEHGYAVWAAETCGWLCVECGDEIEDDTEGPMMNYHYPLPDLNRVGEDPREAATLISDLPLCVVEWPDGSYSLALTGGGTDLSWEICAAFTRLGFLPPFRFAQDPPKLSGCTPDPYVVAACKRTCEVLQGWTEQATERLAANWPI